MGYIPPDARWYLADLVMEIIIEGETRNVVHVELRLVEAGSPEEAFQKAIMLGQEGQLQYCNTEGKQVRVIFRGLRQLNVIHDELGHGAELTYEEWVGVSEKQLGKWLTPKEKLVVFLDDDSTSRKPNYVPDSIMGMIEESLQKKIRPRC